MTSTTIAMNTTSSTSESTLLPRRTTEEQQGNMERPSRAKVVRCLTIAGSDSGGGAGIQADLKTFAARGVFGMSAITAITAQNTTGIMDVLPIPTATIKTQIDAVLSDLGADAIKIGMLASREVIEAVADALARHFTMKLDKSDDKEGEAAELSPRQTLPPVVLDSVMVAKSGDPLLDPSAIAHLPSILRHARLVTPNIPEALLLLEHLGCKNEASKRAVTTVQHVRELALELMQSLRTGHGYTGAVLVKGGHLEEEKKKADGKAESEVNDALSEDDESLNVVDVLCDTDGQLYQFVSPRVMTRSTHGTGCTLSSAIAAELARGRDMRKAVEKAVRYVHGAIVHAPAPDDATPTTALASVPSAYALGSGHGPLDHMWKIKPLLPQLKKCSGKELSLKEREFGGELWRSIEEVYDKILAHPFIEGLTSGNLPEDVFQYYIIQDMHYLRDYSRCLALLAAKADISPSMLLFLESAKSIVGGECAMHLEFCREWGMDVEGQGAQAVLDDHPASPTNMLYTSYLLRIAYDRPYYEGVAAVLPCAWIYNEVGNYLKARGSPNPQYARWISTYGGEEFSITTTKLIELTNRLASELGAEQRKRMLECFVYTSKFEFMFWDAAHSKQIYPV